MGVGGQRHAQADLTPPRKTRYSLSRRLGGPQGRSGQVGKISTPPGCDPRTVQSVTSRYTDWAIPAHGNDPVPNAKETGWTPTGFDPPSVQHAASRYTSHTTQPCCNYKLVVYSSCCVKRNELKAFKCRINMWDLFASSDVSKVNVHQVVRLPSLVPRERQVIHFIFGSLQKISDWG